jgi:hypothetical protein
MPASRTTPTALAAAALVVASAATLPLLAQSTSNIGGGPQTTSNESPADKAIAQRVYAVATAPSRPSPGH